MSTSLKAFKEIIRELKLCDKNFSRHSPQYKFLVSQMRDHQITQKIFSKAPSEAERVAHLYATYLASTRRLIELQTRYKGGERSVEESAKLVGLQLPDRK